MRKLNFLILLFTALLVSGNVWGQTTIEPQRLIKPQVVEAIDEQAPALGDKVLLSKEQLPLSEMENLQGEGTIRISPIIDRLPSAEQAMSMSPRRATNEGENVAALYDAGGQLVQNYTTIAAAITAAADGQTVKLLTSVSQASPITINKAITFDLNGNSLTNNGTAYFVTLYTDPGLEKTVTIDGYNDDFSQKGSILNAGTASPSYYIWRAIHVTSGSLVLNGCDLSSKSYVLYGAGETISLSNTTISGGNMGLININSSSITIGENVSISGSRYGLYSAKANAVITTSSALTNVCTDGAATTFTINTGCSAATTTWALGGATTFNNDGTLELNKNVSYALTINNTGTCSITNGNYTKAITVDNQGTFNISGGQLSADFVLGSGQSCVVNGGTFAVGTQQKPLAYDRIKDFIASGYKAMASSIGSASAMQVVEDSYTAEASYNSTEYATLSAAVATALANTQDPNPEVVLQKDVAINEILTVSNTMTLNIGSHSITGSQYIKLTGGDLTIKGTGSINTTNANSPLWLYAQSNTANLDIQGSVSITGVKYGIYNYYNVKNVTIASTASVSGGTYDIYNYADFENFINHSDAGIVCSGYYIGDITSDGGGSVLIKSGSKIKASSYEKLKGYIESGYKGFRRVDATYGDVFEVKSESTTAVAKIGDVEYISFEDAMACATTDDKIDLLADVTSSAAITIDKQITIDLNGHNWTSTFSNGVYISNNVTVKNSKTAGQFIGNGANAGFWINQDAALTLSDIDAVFNYKGYSSIFLYGANSTVNINNSSLNIAAGAYYGFWDFLGSGIVNFTNSTIIAADGVIAMEGGSVNCTNTDITCTETIDDQTFAIRLEKSSSLVFNSGNLIVSNSTSKYSVGIAMLGTAPSVTINGGYIEAETYAVVGNGGSTFNSSITITGGTLNSLNGSAIYHPQTGTLTISGGTITGQETALEIRSGTANITGGTLISRYEINEEETSPNANGTTTVGVGVAVVQHVTTNPITVNISGNTVIQALLPVKLANPQGNEEEKINTVTVNIEGGKYAALHDASTVFKSVTSNFSVSAGKFSHVPSYVVEGKTVISNPDEDKDVYPYMIGEVSTTTNDAQNTGDIVWEKNADWKLYNSDVKAIPVSTDKVRIFDNQTVRVTGIIGGSGTEKSDGAFAYSINIATGGSLVVDSGAVLVVGGGGIVNNNTDKSGILVKDGGTLLVSPDATEAHPYGSVQLKTVTAKHEKGWEKWYERDHRFQLIGIPTMAQPEIIRGDVGSDHGSSIYLNTWNINSGWTAVTDIQQFNTPFKGYCFWNDAVDTLDADPAETAKLKDSVDYNVLYTFKGNLVGNKQNLMQFQQDGYHFFANSYTAPIDIYSLLAGAENGVQKAVYILLPLEYKYEDVNYAKLNNEVYEYRTIAPMQGFFFLKTTEGTGTAPIDYVSTVWSPSFPGGATPSAMVAPRKQSMSDMTSVRISLTDNTKHRSDNVYLIASDKYSAQEDASDTRKMMNPAMGVNIYAPSNLGNLSTMQTYDLEGQYLAITTNAATSYTLSFDWVKGEELYLTDHVTGQTTLMQEGNAYTFLAESNTAIPDRFEIVRTMPGVVTNVEPIANPAKNIHGIYTMVGQYVGETSNWDQLPKGVYVVNGQKVVK